MIINTFTGKPMELLAKRPDGTCVYTDGTGRVTCRPELLTAFPLRQAEFAPVEIKP